MYALKEVQFLVQCQFNNRLLELRLIKENIINSVVRMTSSAFHGVFADLTENLGYC